jgi:hypothetical protein
MTPEQIGREAISMRRDNRTKPGVLGPMIDQAIKAEDRMMLLADVRKLGKELHMLADMGMRAAHERSIGWLDERVAAIVSELSAMMPAPARRDTGTTTETGAANL